MKKTTKSLFSILTLGVILFLSSCASDQDCSSICLTPDSIGITASNLVKNEVMITFAWPDASENHFINRSQAPSRTTEVKSYSLDIYLNGVLFETANVSGEPKHTINFGALAIDDQVEARVASNCDCGTSKYSPTFAARYQNGGGTVEEILQYNPTREIICQATCEYLKFPNSHITKCDNTSLYLGYNNTGNIYFDQSQICTCLNAYADSCDAIDNLKTCLDNLPKSIKTGGGTCP